MIKATKTDDYENMTPITNEVTEEEAAILIGNKILLNFNDEYQHITYEELKLLEYNGNLVHLEENEEEDVKTCSSECQGIHNGNNNDEDDEEERDLTNLNWLTELRNQTMCLVNMPLDEETKKDNLGSTTIEQISVQQPSNHLTHLTENNIHAKSSASMPGQQNQRIILQIPQQKSDEPRNIKIINQPKRPSPGERYDMFLNKIKRDLETYEESAVSYQSDVVEKPPFNYSHIIGMAMLENGRRVTLQQICSWIERKFAFFRVRKKWNNSIRHNLSLHPCFRKISRNKEDKGKGGYWELGVDPKKCDRKRIRNRKSTAQSAKMQKKTLQSHLIKTTKMRPQNYTRSTKMSFKHCNLRNFTCDQQYEELMLDEMDVQQNIDVMSTNTNLCYKQPTIKQTVNDNSQNAHNDEEEVILTSFINDNDDEFNENRCSAGFQISSENERSSKQTCKQEQQPPMQQYKVDTIIISSENVGTDMPNIYYLNQRRINSFLTTNSTKQLLPEEHLCTNSTYYSQSEKVPQNEVIITPYSSNLPDGVTNCVHATKSNQSHNFGSSSYSNSITLDFSTFPTQSKQQKANVIVEQLIEQPSVSYSAIKISPDCAATSSPVSSLSYSAATIGSQNGDYAIGLGNEHFGPYIDGVDEAFKFLRSLDITRNDDILDNLLDISVSDY